VTSEAAIAKWSSGVRASGVNASKERHWVHWKSLLLQRGIIMEYNYQNFIHNDMIYRELFLIQVSTVAFHLAETPIVDCLQAQKTPGNHGTLHTICETFRFCI